MLGTCILTGATGDGSILGMQEALSKLTLGFLFPFFADQSKSRGSRESSLRSTRERRRTLATVVLANRGGFVFCIVDQLGYLWQC